jgi:signal transduction histidine kinase
VSVTDNGVGIADNEKQRIFDRFYRIGDEKVRKTKGTGLGLYLCKRIAFEHNARIVVTDNLPTGANFTIQFQV